MKPRHKRAAIVVGVLAAVGVAVGLVLNAFNSNLVFFYTPTQVASKEAPQGRTFQQLWAEQQAGVDRSSGRL